MYRSVEELSQTDRGTQRQFSENVCSEDDLRSRIFETFVVNFLFACHSQNFRTSKKWYNCPFLTDFQPKKVTLEFSGAFFLAETFEKASFDPYNFRIMTRLSARKSEQMKNFQGKKFAYICRLNTKIRLTMLCRSGFELNSRWLPLD